MRYYGSCLTDINNYRQTNEDTINLAIEKTDFGEVALAIVCDGMGGHAKGDYASQKLSESLTLWLYSEFIPMLDDGFQPTDIHDTWFRILKEVNHELVTYGDSMGKGVGTTVTAALFFGNQYFCIHVGDSRMITVDDDVSQLTRDMTLVERELRAGVLTEEEALVSPNKHILVSCIGITEDFDYQFIIGEVDENTSYLLCSDGFHGELNIHETQRMLRDSNNYSEVELKRVLSVLVEDVKQSGEKDNISVVLVKARE